MLTTMWLCPLLLKLYKMHDIVDSITGNEKRLGKMGPGMQDSNLCAFDRQRPSGQYYSIVVAFEF